MTTLREAAQQALDALCHARSRLDHSAAEWDCDTAIESLEAALAEPVQEPVAWMGVHDRTDLYCRKPQQADVVPLYTAPPQRKPLTDEELCDEVRAADLDWQTGWSLNEDAPNRYITLARAIERAHGIGGEE